LKTNKKILIVSYYWPPAGGPGVQRWLKFVKYLPEFGFEPIVFIPKCPNYPVLDYNLEAEIDDKIQIIKQDFFEPYQIAKFFASKKTDQMRAGLIQPTRKLTSLDKILLWVRGNIFIPDARIFWINPATRAIQDLIKIHQIDTIITTGPPHSLHLIGLKLKIQNNSKLRWIADFRDPWTTISYHSSLRLSKWAQKKHFKLEQDVLQNADQIIVTSKVTKAEFLLKTNKPVEVITNGFDENRLDLTSDLDQQFTLAHIGTLLSERNPRILWKALKELCNENLGFRRDFKLKLVGRTSPEILATLKEFKLENHLENIGYVTHEEAIKMQRSAQVLLLIEINSPQTRCIIPGKLFEYFNTNRPILALGPEDSDVAAMIKATQTGAYFEYDQKDELKKHLEELYHLFQLNKLHVNPLGIDIYHRRNLTRNLARLLK